MNVKEFLTVTDTGGVLRDRSDPSSLLRVCSPSDETKGVAQGWIRGGMSVKLQTACSTLEKEVPNVWILGMEDVLQKQRGTSIVR